MARSAEGWRLKRDPRSGIRSVRFRHAGKRYDLSTGERDVAKARKKAVDLYTGIVQGTHRIRARSLGEEPLRDLLCQFVLDLEGEVNEHTANCYRWTATSHIEPFFRTLDGFTSARIAAFCKARLKAVQRSSLRGDLKVLRRFFAWAIEHELMSAAPIVPPLPKCSSGTKANKRKARAVPLHASEALAIIAALPERSARTGFPVRARFAVQWETSLRQATIGRLRVPEHYRKGARTLLITNPIDKAKFGRELPLTDAARAALDSVCPDEGLIFGSKIGLAYRPYLIAAAKRAGLPQEKVDAFSAYDFRHGRITDLLAKGAPLTAVAFLAGHKKITTTNTYVQVAQAGAAAAEALRLTGGITGGDSET